MNTKTIQLEIKGMTCHHCALTIEQALSEEGILRKTVSFRDHSAKVSFNEEVISEEKIITLIHNAGSYRVTGRREVPDNAGDVRHLLIIGGGSAAFAAALQAHESGARVTMINDGLPIGGTCVNVGCVPSKNLIRAAETLHRARNPHFEGIQTEGQLIDFNKIINQKRELVNLLRQEKYINVVRDLERFTLIEGRAKLVASDTVEVNGQKISADAILIATGAAPRIPSIPGLEETGYLTNETAFELERLPEHVVILGGNYIGLEIAQMFSRLGSRVSVVEIMPQILPTEGPDVAEEIQEHLQKEGIVFYRNAQTNRVFKDGKDTVLELSMDGNRRTLRCSHLIVATGRKANTAGMELEEIGVELTENGFLKVDAHLQTSVTGIYGAGDVIGAPMFVYTAAYEGKLAALNALSPVKQTVDYTALPWVIFTDPQVAGIGPDERQASEMGIDTETAVLPLAHVPRAIAARDTRGFIKLIRNKANDRLIGARIVAPEGSELLMEIAMAIKFGIKVEQLKEMFHPYLTLSEGIKLAAITFSKDVKELSCCAT